jgi:hypothetical protein
MSSLKAGDTFAGQDHADAWIEVLTGISDGTTRIHRMGYPKGDEETVFPEQWPEQVVKRLVIPA